MRLIKVVITGAVMASATGCSSLVGDSLLIQNSKGDFTMSANEKGLQSVGEMLAGLVVTGKSAPNVRDAFFDLRETATKMKALKFSKGGRDYSLNTGGDK